MVRGQYRRLGNVCCSVEPELGGRVGANSAKRVYRDQLVVMRGKRLVYTVGQGNVRMALVGPAVTVIRLPKQSDVEGISPGPCWKRRELRQRHTALVTRSCLHERKNAPMQQAPKVCLNATFPL